MKIDPNVYNQKYFLSIRCEGYYEFKKNDLSPIKQIEVSLLELKKKDKVLDIGTGRGDIVAFLSRNNFDLYGIDYSKDAVKMSRKRVAAKYRKNITAQDASKLQFPNKSFDKALLGDVVEHMTYDEALSVVNEAFRVLKPGGILVIHTAPNLWFKKYIFPITKIALKIIGLKKVVSELDSNIVATYKYHVDEYSIVEIRKLMEKSKFSKHKCWIHPDALRISSNNYLSPLKKNPLIRLFSILVNKTPLINLFGNDLFVVAKK